MSVSLNRPLEEVIVPETKDESTDFFKITVANSIGEFTLETTVPDRVILLFWPKHH